MHPDFFSNASQDDRENAARASSAINVAYRTLREPLTRAEYLLDPEAAKTSHGSEPAAGRRPEFDFPASPELLSDVMEARELISDADTPGAVLAALMTRTRTAVAACESDLSAAFRAGDELGARKVAAALSYYTKIVQEVEQRLELENSR